MDEFQRDDGRTLRVVPGFRDRVLAAPRLSVQPKPEWSDEDFRAAADKKRRHAAWFLDQFVRFGGAVAGAHLLEVGCGAGIDALLLALQPVDRVVGVDMDLPLFESGDRGERTRRLAREVLIAAGRSGDIDAELESRPVRFATMDVRRMAFADGEFDLLWSRAAMEHIVPPEPALAEMARVVRPGGLIYHSIDPFYWLKGCHKGGVVDIPWAHARLTPAEYRRFAARYEGEDKAEKRARHLRSLNQLTPRQWRATIEAGGPFDILDWQEEHWPLAESLLAEHPDVLDTLLPGVEPGDLTCRQIKVWMRNRHTVDRSVPH